MSETYSSFIFGIVIAFDVIIFIIMVRCFYTAWKDQKKEKEKAIKLEQQRFISEQNNMILDELKKINAALNSLCNKEE